MKDIQDYTIKELVAFGYEVRCIGRDVGGDVSKSSIHLSSRDWEQLSEVLNSPVKISKQLQKLSKVDSNEWYKERKRWLAQGAFRERERITNLLEEHIGYGDSEWDANVKAIIALIKGEK